MNPWKDRVGGGARHWQQQQQQQQPPPTPATPSAAICEGYPQCPKDERKCLNEIRAAGRGVPLGFKLSNGLKATEFCLQYIMKNHFKRKQPPSRKAPPQE